MSGSEPDSPVTGAPLPAAEDQGWRLAAAVVEFRGVERLSRARLAARLQVSVEQIRRIENGEPIAATACARIAARLREAGQNDLALKFQGTFEVVVRKRIAVAQLTRAVHACAIGPDQIQRHGLVGDFLASECELIFQSYATVSQMRRAYQDWCLKQERRPLGIVDFCKDLLAAGCRRSHSRRIGGKQTRTWEGVRLKVENGGSHG